MKSTLLFLFSLFLISFSAHAETVNVNKADAVVIAKYLSGIGLVKAQAIVDYRTEHGDFESLDDLTKVPGIGSIIVESNKDKLSIDDKSAEVSMNPINGDKKGLFKGEGLKVAGAP